MAPTPTPTPTPSVAGNSTLSSKLSLKIDKDSDIILLDTPKEFKIKANETLKVALLNKYDNNYKNLKIFIL